MVASDPKADIVNRLLPTGGGRPIQSGGNFLGHLRSIEKQQRALEQGCTLDRPLLPTFSSSFGLLFLVSLPPGRTGMEAHNG
jgi:hypothetical protein